MMRLTALVACALALASPTLAQERVFFGNLHSHTGKSDGSSTPRRAYDHARNNARIHFLMLSEHNHNDNLNCAIADNPVLYSDPGNVTSSVGAANRANIDGTFVALYGQEFSTHSAGNHVNVFDIPNVIPTAMNGNFAALLEWLARPENLDSSGRVALIQFNHPWAESSGDEREYGHDDFSPVSEWVRRMDEVTELIEVVNGPAKNAGTNLRPANVEPSHYRQYLNLGFHVGPTANQDNHRQNWGNSTTARTGIVTTELSKVAIMNALRARHVFATTDVNLQVIARVNGALMGDIIDPGQMAVGSELAVTLTIVDGGEVGNSATNYRVRVYSDDGPGGAEAAVVAVQDASGVPNVPVQVTIPEVIYRGPGQYLFLEVTQFAATDAVSSSANDKLWTAPVWLERPIAPVGPAVAQAGPRIVSLLPNSASPEGQTEQITIHNAGAQPVDLSGWTVRDMTGATWQLSGLGSIAAGATLTITRNGQPMSLNNAGDTVSLVNADGLELQVVTYGAAAEGEVVQVAGNP
jgi:hypothetical protein